MKERSLSPLRRWLRSERARDNAEFTSPDGAPTVNYAWSFVDIAIVRAAYLGFIERKEVGGTRLLVGLWRTMRPPRVYYMDGV